MKKSDDFFFFAFLRTAGLIFYLCAFSGLVFHDSAIRIAQCQVYAGRSISTCGIDRW